MKKINKIIERKNRKINYLETANLEIIMFQILDKDRLWILDKDRPWILDEFQTQDSGNSKPQVLEMDLAGDGTGKPQILDAEEVQKSGNLSPEFWKELVGRTFTILYSIKLELRSQILEGIDRWMYKW